MRIRRAILAGLLFRPPIEVRAASFFHLKEVIDTADRALKRGQLAFDRPQLARNQRLLPFFVLSSAILEQSFRRRLWGNSEPAYIEEPLQDRTKRRRSATFVLPTPYFGEKLSSAVDRITQNLRQRLKDINDLTQRSHIDEGSVSDAWNLLGKFSQLGVFFYYFCAIDSFRRPSRQGRSPRKVKLRQSSTYSASMATEFGSECHCNFVHFMRSALPADIPEANR